MPTYYVRTTGSDSNAGTSAGAAWRTVGKALGAAGISSGDTVYIGPGVYGEQVSAALTSPVVETFVLGDPLGEQTGDDPGPVIMSGFDTSSYTPETGTAIALATNSRDYMTFRDLWFYGAGTGTGNSAVRIQSSQNLRFTRCMFQYFGDAPSNGNAALFIECAAGETTDHIIEDSILHGYIGLRAVMTRHSADYDANITFRRNIIAAASVGVAVGATGAGAGYGNGIDIDQCTIEGSNGVYTLNTEISTTYPTVVKDCLILSFEAAANTILRAAVSGQITDSGGNVGWGGGLTNTTAHATSRYGDGIMEGIMSLGHEWIWGLPARKPYSLYPALVAIGHEGAGTTGLDNSHSIFDGTGVFGDSGTATSANTDDLSDSTKTWGINQWKGWLLRITGGTGSGQVKRINANTATELDISGAAPSGGLWATTPSTDSTYIIYQGPPVETGNASSGSSTTLVDSGANWTDDQWNGYTVSLDSGTGNGQTATVTDTTSGTTLTFSALGGDAPDDTTNYSIYKDSLTANQAAPGALAAHDTMKQESTTVDASTYSGRIEGYGSHEFQIPVGAFTTVISVRVNYDSSHGTGSKPQAILLANDEIGVSTETVTASGGSGSWETLQFAAITPTAAGVVTVRLQSRSATPYGRCYFDSWSVS